MEITPDMTDEEKKAVREARKLQKEAEKRAKKERQEASRAARGGGGADAVDAIVQEVSFLAIDQPPQQYAGPYKRVQSECSAEGSGRVFADITQVNHSMADQTVWIRGRVVTTRAKGKNMAFLVVRRDSGTIQVVVEESNTITRPLIKWICTNMSTESIVDIEGVVKLAEVKACTQKDVEILATRVYLVSKARDLPFSLEDAARPESVEGNHVKRDTRLDSRFIDLRGLAHKSILHIQSGVCQLFRNTLLARGFIEIHSPKLIGGSSEGGADVFKTDYFGREACLAQSPQLYKQMAICADFGKVFEIGPVFRAENSNTHRHMCEFMGLDFEMEIDEHYYEVLRLLDVLFVSIFDGLNSDYSNQLTAINEQYPFEPLKYHPAGKNLILEYPQGMAMLREAGVEIDDYDDLNTENEKCLGKLVREKYGTDFFALSRFPSAVRPFYTMPDVREPEYSNSFDVFIRGEEILSGAQRIHDPDLLVERAKKMEIDVSTIESYVNAFRYGAPPHGGAGVGLERVVMLFLGIPNIRECSLFPRDPNRLAP